MKHLLNKIKLMFSKKVYFGDGLNFKTGCSQKITIPDTNRADHFLCIGVTRSGKTCILENMVKDDIRKGYNVMVIDPDGDIELFSKMTQIAFEAGRRKEVIPLKMTQEIAESVPWIINELRSNRGLILLAQTPCYLQSSFKKIYGKFLLSMINALGWYNGSSDSKVTPFCIYVDEAQYVLGESVGDIFAKANIAGVLTSANIWLHCFLQTFHQLYSLYDNKVTIQQMLNNVKTKMFMAQYDIEDINYIHQSFGDLKQLDPQRFRVGEFLLQTYEDRFYGETYKILK